MSEMTRKTVVFHVRRKKLHEVSVPVAGNVLKMVAKQVLPWAGSLGSRPEVKLKRLRGTRRAVPGAAVPSKWPTASGGWKSAKSAVKPPRARSGQPEPPDTAQVR